MFLKRQLFVNCQYVCWNKNTNFASYEKNLSWLLLDCSYGLSLNNINTIHIYIYLLDVDNQIQSLFSKWGDFDKAGLTDYIIYKCHFIRVFFSVSLNHGHRPCHFLLNFLVLVLLRNASLGSRSDFWVISLFLSSTFDTPGKYFHISEVLTVVLTEKQLKEQLALTNSHTSLES